MEDKIPYDLITKYLAGQSSTSEKADLEKWKAESIEHVEIINQMKMTWDAGTPPAYKADTEKALQKVHALIDKKQKTRTPIIRIIGAVAASVIILMGLFTYLRSSNRIEEIVLTSLANAKPTKHVLPDGSSVTLNKGSKIVFPESFKADERRVVFSGEAYFSIQSDTTKPFIIESGDTETRVVGTEFNLRSRSDSVVQVFVTEGKVALSAVLAENKEIYIEPGQVGSYSAAKKLLEKKINEDRNFLSWKSGVLSFEQEFLRDALPQIEKLYEVKLSVQDSSLRNMIFTATFDSMSVDELTQNLELILGVDVEQEGNMLTLK